MKKLSQVNLSLGRRSLPGGVAALLVIGLLKLGVWHPLENLSYNLLFRLRGSTPWDERIVVIAIDETSLESLNTLPWPRQHYTRLLQVLLTSEPSQRPAVIAIDAPLPGQDPEDRALAGAIAAHEHVILTQLWDQQGEPIALSPVLKQTATAIGHILKPEEMAEVPQFVLPQKDDISALGIAAVAAYSPGAAASTDLPSPLWINWPGAVQTLPHYSFVDVLAGNVSPEAFEDKIVLIGPTTSTFDALQTPFDRDPAVGRTYLQAAIIHNLLQNSFLRTPLSGWLSLLLLVSGPALSWGLTHPRLRRRILVIIALSLSWGLLSVLLLHLGIFIPPATPIILILATAGAVVTYEQLKTNVLLQEQLKMNALLQQSEERYELAVRGSNEGLWDWDLQTQEIYFSPRWKSLLGYQEHEIGSHCDEWFNRIHPEERESVQEAIAAHLSGETSHFEQEHRVQHRDGTYHWMLSRGLAVRDNDGKAYRMAGSQTDITERKHAEQQIRHYALYDTLTDLPNRALFLSRIRQALQRVKHKKYPCAVCFIALDRLKVITDSLGHDAGDQLLVAIARRLVACMHHRDIVAHLGGGEFAILLRKTRNASHAVQIADRVHKALSLPFHLDVGFNNPSPEPPSIEFQEVFTTASIGIALSHADYDHPESLLRDADIAMNKVKALAQGRTAVFNASMHGYSTELLQLETDLRRAIKRQELRVYYQPIVALSTGQITGFEALVRWQHYDRGMVTPGEFIAVAEETGLITSLGWWVLREACRQLRLWQDQFPLINPLKMSVNLSGVQFAQPDMIAQIESILRDTGLDGSSLKLEITEGVIMVNAQSVTDLLQQLQRLHIQLCIDDFGTGYSSLGRLHHLPINTLKIDRSFLGSTDQSGEWEIVRTIITLAHNLGLDVIAEGIETPIHVEHLKALDCEYGQGYFFSKPEDVPAIEQLLLKQSHSVYSSQSFTP